MDVEIQTLRRTDRVRYDAACRRVGIQPQFQRGDKVLITENPQDQPWSVLSWIGRVHRHRYDGYIQVHPLHVIEYAPTAPTNLLPKIDDDSGHTPWLAVKEDECQIIGEA